MSGQPVTVVATFKIKRGDEGAFEAAIHEHVPNCVADPGLLRFWVYRDQEDPGRFMFYEDWESRTFFDQSMEAPWRGPYMAATEHLWAEPRVIRVYERMSVAWDPLGADGQPESLRRDR